MNNKTVITFGRCNPPTVGHEKLVNKVKQVGRLENADPLVFLSHSCDSKKNPLDYATKFKYCKKAFGKSVQASMSRNIIDIMKELEKFGYEEVILVVGSDRIDEMSKLLNKYNDSEYSFKSINVVSAGDRDPDADGVDGMSASKMRELAEIQDLVSFKQGLPSLLQPKAAEVMQKVREGLNLN